MFSSRSIVQTLEGIWLFQSCSKRELGTVAKLGSVVPFGAGEVLVRRGDRGTRFLVVLEGKVEVARRGFSAKRLGPGTAIGEISLLDGGASTATVTAAGPGQLFVVARADFDRLLGDAPAVTRKLLEAFALRLRTAEREVERLQVKLASSPRTAS